MDAGIATEDNLALVREKGYDYVCVSRHRLQDLAVRQAGYSFDNEDPSVVAFTDRGKSNVTLKTFQPKGYEDT